MVSWHVVPTVVYPIPDRISDGYLIWDRIYYGQLFISNKNKLVQWTSVSLSLLAPQEREIVITLIYPPTLICEGAYEPEQTYMYLMYV